MKIGIVGAGIIGRLLAWQCHQRGHHVSLFDKTTLSDQRTCSWVAAGMLAPQFESRNSAAWIVDAGKQAIARWPEIISQLGVNCYFQQRGSLLITAKRHASELQLWQQRADSHGVSDIDLQQIEPWISHEYMGVYLDNEAVIDTDEIMQALADAVRESSVVLHEICEVPSCSSRTIETHEQTLHFERVIDCRGLGAKSQLTNLRGVRGELIHLHAPEVTLNHPLHLLHPRFPLYCLPRANHHFIVGATEVESEDSHTPITTISLLELLSSLYHCHRGFANASLSATRQQCRPTFIDNEPKIQVQPGLISINGLFRYGFLLAPIVIDATIALIEETALPKQAQPLIHGGRYATHVTC